MKKILLLLLIPLLFGKVSFGQVKIYSSYVVLYDNASSSNKYYKCNDMYNADGSNTPFDNCELGNFDKGGTKILKGGQLKVDKNGTNLWWNPVCMYYSIHATGVKPKIFNNIVLPHDDGINLGANKEQFQKLDNNITDISHVSNFCLQSAFLLVYRFYFLQAYFL